MTKGIICKEINNSSEKIKKANSNHILCYKKLAYITAHLGKPADHLFDINS